MLLVHGRRGTRQDQVIPDAEPASQGQWLSHDLPFDASRHARVWCHGNEWPNACHLSGQTALQVAVERSSLVPCLDPAPLKHDVIGVAWESSTGMETFCKHYFATYNASQRSVRDHDQSSPKSIDTPGIPVQSLLSKNHSGSWRN